MSAKKKWHAPGTRAARGFQVRTLSGLVLISGRLIALVPFHHFRLFAYRHLLGMKIGRGSTVYRTPEIHRPSSVTIGNNTIIGRDAILDGRRGLTIGDNVNLSTGVWVWSEQHDKDSPSFAPDGGPVVIGDRAWLSCRTIVLPGVTIGEGAVVCAGAVVTKDVAPYSVVAGIPAKKIAERNSELTYTLAHRVPFL